MLPQYWKLMLPILRISSDGKTYHRNELANILADQFNLTEEERNQLKPSGGQTLFENRIGWATFDLSKAGLVKREKGFVTITEEGKKILSTNPEKIDRKFLLSVPKYAEFYKSMMEKRKERIDDELTTNESPEDMMITGHKIIRKNVESELLEKIENISPQFFERLVLELVRNMGYGIDHAVLGRTGDGGIDGVIKEDKLGLDEIYFQAKRWKGTVPIHQVRDFAGALMANKSKKGIFITSSDFSNDAYSFVKNIDSKIILINGEQLARFMYDYNLGVKVQDTYEIKKIDYDYFEE
ncbi:MAG: restriction endonuclease [Candidatus Nitrosotenuis sp.]